jgi:hypothetical protein
MTEGSKRRPSRPALATRIVAAGASVAATIGLVGVMASGASTAGAEAPAVEPPAPQRVVVVVKKVAPRVTRARSATARPRIVRRYVRTNGAAARPATTTKGS